MDEAVRTMARRAYELGRLRASAAKAAAICAPIAAVGYAFAGPRALAWIPVALAAWMVALWRGGPVLRGAFFGLAGGVVTFLLPMSILRPCCAPSGMTATMASSADCCTAPGACLAAGGVVGVVMSALVSRGSGAWWRKAAGMALGASSVAIFKCATLFAGEAVGLIGGIAAGLIAASAARSLVVRRPV
jgi:hypothetical protein